MKLPKPGQRVAITFLDHCEGSTKPIRFCVFGKVAKVGKESIAVNSWAYPNKDHKGDGNEATFCIVTSAIETIELLTSVETHHRNS